jgi:phosphatidate cytidylyltransferase
MEPAPALPTPSAAAPAASDLSDRLAVSMVLIPAALLVIDTGGWPYALIVGLMLVVAAREYVRLFAHTHYRPAGPVVLGGVGLLVLSAEWPALNPNMLLVALIILAALVWHLVDYERGATYSGTDFVITLGGIFYLGWLGRYFITLRAQPAGLWWLVAALTSMWLADTGAYIFGRLFGRRWFKTHMAPRLSPRKTWEGYLGSIVFGGLAGALGSLLWGLGAGPAGLLTWQTGGLLGLLVGALGPLGDLGVSMLKRQSGVKDAGVLIAGHGGALDRIDSWLVAVPLGFYFLLLVRALAGG